MTEYKNTKSGIEDILDHREIMINGGQEARTLLFEMQQKRKEASSKGIFMPLEFLFALFRATEFEQFCVQICLIEEIFPGEVNTSFQHLIELFACDYEERILCKEAFQPEQILNRYFLDGTIQTKWTLKNRIREFVLLEEYVNKRLAPFAVIWNYKDEIEEQEDFMENLFKMVNFYETQHNVIFQLVGLEGSGKLDCSKYLAKELMQPLLIVDLKKIVTEQKNCIQEILFEAQIHGCGVCYQNFEILLEVEEDWGIAALIEDTRKVTDFIVCLSEKLWSPQEILDAYELYTLPIAAPSAMKRVKLWEELLGTSDFPVEELANKFIFTKGQISKAVKHARRNAHIKGREELIEEDLYQGCLSLIPKVKNNHKLVKINKGYRWEDLVLPPHSIELLHTACNRIHHGHVVYDQWGFLEKLPYGKGVSMIFAGPPGTGKTMGAQVMAQQLSLEIYKINLAGVVNKFIGETEKNLEYVFEQGMKSQAILFFDEADVLFSKRTEVKDSNDKYSNMEAAFMLQKIEEYEGICILATNYIQNFDEAFKRRIKFLIDFPFPNEPYRLLIWQCVFPKETPVSEDIDFPYLAKTFELSGSNIKNIAINAAFEAATDDCEAIEMSHIIKALKVEYAKSGKGITKEDLGPYFLLY